MLYNYWRITIIHYELVLYNQGIQQKFDRVKIIATNNQARRKKTEDQEMNVDNNDLTKS